MCGVNRGLKKGIVNKRLRLAITCVVHLIQRLFTKSHTAWTNCGVWVTCGNLRHSAKKIRTQDISRLVASQRKQKGVLMVGLLETCRG